MTTGLKGVEAWRQCTLCGVTQPPRVLDTEGHCADKAWCAKQRNAPLPPGVAPFKATVFHGSEHDEAALKSVPWAASPDQLLQPMELPVLVGKKKVKLVPKRTKKRRKG
jgi:hypothetical protein